MRLLITNLLSLLLAFGQGPILDGIMNVQPAAGGGGTVALVGSTTNGDNGGSSGSVTLTKTPSSTSDFFAVAMEATNGTCTNLAVSDSKGTVTSVFVKQSGSQFPGINAVAIITGLGSGSHSIVATQSGGTCPSGYVAECIMEFSGTPNSSPVDQVATSGSQSSSPASSSPTVTLSQNKELGITIGGSSGNTMTGTSTGNSTYACPIDSNSYATANYTIFTSGASSYASTVTWTGAASSANAYFGTIKMN